VCERERERERERDRERDREWESEQGESRIFHHIQQMVQCPLVE